MCSSRHVRVNYIDVSAAISDAGLYTHSGVIKVSRGVTRVDIAAAEDYMLFALGNKT